MFTILSLGILQPTLLQMIGKMNFLQMKASQCQCKCLIERLSIIGNYRSVGLGLNVGVLEDIAEILRAAFTELLSIWWCWEGKTLANLRPVIHHGVTVPIGVGASEVVVGFSEVNIIFHLLTDLQTFRQTRNLSPMLWALLCSILGLKISAVAQNYWLFGFVIYMYVSIRFWLDYIWLFFYLK